MRFLGVDDERPGNQGRHPDPPSSTVDLDVDGTVGTTGYDPERGAFIQCMPRKEPDHGPRETPLSHAGAGGGVVGSEPCQRTWTR